MSTDTPRFSAFKRGALAVAAVAVAATLLQGSMPQAEATMPQISSEQVTAPWRALNRVANQERLERLDGVAQEARLKSFNAYLRGDDSRVVVGVGGITIQFHLDAGRGSFQTPQGARALDLGDLERQGAEVARAARRAITDTLRNQSMDALIATPEAFGAAVASDLQDTLDRQMGGQSLVVIDEVDLGLAVEKLFDPSALTTRNGASVQLPAAEGPASPGRSSLSDTLQARRIKDIREATALAREEDGAIERACRKNTCG